MKIIFGAWFAVLSVTAVSLASPAQAQADDSCVPASSVICTIQSDGACNPTYQLRTTFQSVDSIYLYDPAGTCQPAAADIKAALAKLDAQAQALKNAGVCKIVINDPE